MTGFSEGASDIQIFMCRGYWVIFYPAEFFRSGVPEKKRGVMLLRQGVGVSVKPSGDQMPNDAYNDEYEEECEGVRHGLSSC